METCFHSAPHFAQSNKSGLFSTGKTNMKVLFSLALILTTLETAALAQEGVFRATLSYELVPNSKPTQMSGTALFGLNDYNVLYGFANIDFANEGDFVTIWRSASTTDRGEWFWFMQPLAGYTRSIDDEGTSGWTFNMRESRVFQPSMIDDLKAGRYWLEVQSAKNPGEVIRGQILPVTVPEPSSWALMILGIFAGWWTKMRPALQGKLNAALLSSVNKFAGPELQQKAASTK
jgi:hypothetical protein